MQKIRNVNSLQKMQAAPLLGKRQNPGASQLAPTFKKQNVGGSVNPDLQS